jgi:DnaJ-class molecular chaperone
MNTRFHVIGIGSVCVLVLISIAARNPSRPSPDGGEAVQAAEEAESSEHNHAEQDHLRELSRLQTEQQRHNHAAQRMKAYRQDIEMNRRALWTRLISAHTKTFLALRQQAALSPKGEARCTLCDGRGTIDPCVLCADRHGRCVSCNGTGKLKVDEYCPACLGSGNCFLCAGTRKMTCPFCDDGIITANRPMPSERMPID